MSSDRLAKKVRYALRFLPGELYIQLDYFARFKKFANLKRPATYNEGLSWLKSHNHNPLYAMLVDKYEVKEYVEGIIGDRGGGIIPTLGIWRRFEDINFEVLPNQFALRCTHDSEGLVIVKNKNLLDKKAAKVEIEDCLERNFHCIGYEWPYKNVKLRIIAEKYMEDVETGEFRDYKFFCSNGEPKAMFIASDRNSSYVKFDYYDTEFNYLDTTQKYPSTEIPSKKPNCSNEMIVLAEKSSFGTPCIRVDLYEVNGSVYSGKMTFFHFSGFISFKPNNQDRVLEGWLILPARKVKC